MLQRFRDKSFFSSLQLETSPDRISTWQYIILGVLIFFGCYYGLTSYAILDMNEGLYAEVAREMVVNHHFIVPYLNDVPYLEKPPLLYWFIALSYHVFGVNVFAARIIPSTFTALMCLGVFFAGKKLQTPRTGFIAAVILSSSLVFLMIGRVVFFDMILCFFIAATLFFFYLFTQAESEKKDRYIIPSYISLGLAVLTKGLMALAVTVPIMLVFLFLINAPKSHYKELLNKKALIIFCIIVLPWHILAMLSFSGFTWEYFINNQILRFFNARMPHDYHTGPLYYYIPRVIGYLLPFTIFLPFIFWPIKLKRPFAPLHAFLWTWFLFMLVFFSLSGDKGDYYMIIGIVPLAWLLAERIEVWMLEGKARWLTTGFSLITLAMGVAGIVSLVLYRSTRDNLAAQAVGDKIPAVLTMPVLITTIVILLYGVTGFYLCRRNTGKPMLPFLLLAGIMVPSMLLFLTIKERTQFTYSQAILAKYVQSQYEHRYVYFYQDFEDFSSFVFYNREPAVIVDSHSSDLYYGSQLKENKNKFISLEDFLNMAKKNNLYVVVRADKLAEFQKLAGNQFCVVQRNRRAALLSNAQEDCHALIQIGEEKAFNLEELKKENDEKTLNKINH